jgi:hypothetical protein
VKSSDPLRRIERDSVIALVVLTAAALVISPTRPRVALGVVGGGVLAGLSYWAIRGFADGVARGAISGQNLSNSGVFALVKFFTRHAILAVAGYGMMTRLELDPIGLLMGVSAPGIAAVVEAARSFAGSRP